MTFGLFTHSSILENSSNFIAVWVVVANEDNHITNNIYAFIMNQYLSTCNKV